MWQIEVELGGLAEGELDSRAHIGRAREITWSIHDNTPGRLRAPLLERKDHYWQGAVRFETEPGHQAQVN